jgi:hypothetical protein
MRQVPVNLNEAEAADYLKLSHRTLQGYRVKGCGPAFACLGRRIIYRRTDLDAWVASHVVQSTSQRSAGEK